MIEKIYLTLPYPLQNLVLSIFGFFNDKRRYGKQFSTVLKQSTKRIGMTEENLRGYQREMLSNSLKNAEKSKFWKKRFNEFSVDVNGDPYEEIQKLPVLSKKEVQAHSSEIVIEEFKECEVHTSGTTGGGLIFWETVGSEQARWAVWWRYRNRLGINEGDWCGLFGGRNIISPAYRGTVFHRINYASNQVLFSCYHLSKETVKYYVDALNKKCLMWLHGYPSFLSELAGLAIAEGLKLKYTPTVITIGAENLSSHQSDLIFRFFGVTPRQHYGLAESVSNISESRDGRLVVDEDFSYTEFNESNLQGCYKIVGSNFTNKAFPLFRYDSGDLAYGVNESVFPREVKAIDGRKEDVIFLKSGAVVGRLDHIFKDAIYVNEAQIIQKRDLSLIIKVVCSDLWVESKHYSELLREFRSRLGDDLDISIECVNRIQRTKSGKLRFVISEVNKVETNTSGHE